MEEKKIDKTILVSAAPERVWEILFDNEINKRWYDVFHPGSHAVTDWQQGSRATFLDSDKNGITGIVTTNQIHKKLLVEYDGVVSAGNFDHESDFAADFKGGLESYELQSIGEQTELHVVCDMAPVMFDIMSDAWDRALAQIKILAESKQ